MLRDFVGGLKPTFNMQVYSKSAFFFFKPELLIIYSIISQFTRSFYQDLFPANLFLFFILKAF